MAIACPNCDHKLALKSARPGRFRPSCPVCRKPFVLTVSDQHGATLQVRALAPVTGVATKGDAPATVGAQPAAAETLGPGANEIVLEPIDPCAATQDALAFSVALPDSGAAPADAESPALPARAVVEVKGYTIERELGRGGMGTVYLARQLSLDRYVALKVMSKRWATDPVFVARFTREAYAAAQLSHPNIVHIHDMGEAGGTRYFSMEYVPGRTLADLVKARGKLDTETAVGYVLQAARGLKHAHDRGLIHRDVKPDNLLLDDLGHVKVSDLGLVKTPATRPADDAVAGPDGPPAAGLGSLPADMTGARIALGTPAYMSPEQCRDAAAVDHRADIYSLGCTLYVLVTGRQPFSGTTAVELMTKHAYEPLVPPEHIVARVPKEVSEVIQRMMAKEADDRFQTMGEVIQTLEAWLGIRRAGSFSPSDDQINRLEGYVHRFNHAPAAVLRRRVAGGFFSAAALAAVLVLFFGNPVWALGLVGLVVQASLAYFVLHGVARRGYLFTRTRQFLGGLTWGDRVVGVAAVALFGVVLAMTQAFWVWVGFGLIGVGLAFALRLGIDRQAEEEEREQVEACQRFLRRLREQGLDGEEVRHFVAKFAGRHWEAFFEALFGFEAKLAARAVLLRGGAAGVREKYAAWREPLVAGMDRVEKARREARERELLRAVGLAELLAAGATPQAAEGRAAAAADALVRAAGNAPEPATSAEAGPGGRQNPFDADLPPEASSRLVNLFVGVHVRAAAAALLIAACALWVHQTAVAPAAEAQSHAAPLLVAGVPDAATAWVDGWNVGAAGLLLVASLLYRGNVMAVFALLGAAVAAVGHQHGIRTVEPFRAEHVGLMLGFVLALVGFRAGR